MDRDVEHRLKRSSDAVDLKKIVKLRLELGQKKPSLCHRRTVQPEA